MALKRLFNVNLGNVLGVYYNQTFKIFSIGLKEKLSLILLKRLDFQILDFWISNDYWIYFIVFKEDGLELRKSQAFENEITVKLNIKEFKYFKVSGNYIVVVSDRLDVYSKHVQLINSIDVNYATSQVSLALDLFERFVGYSTDSILVLKKDGIQGVVNFVLNVI